MKKTLSLSRIFLVALCGTILLASCSKSEDATNIVNQPNSIDGSWRISYYFDNTDETADFAGYTFSFNSNGQLTAANGTNTITGTWSQTSSKLVISFGTDPFMSELNDDWLIEEKTSNSIKLKDDNPAQDDRLQFSRL